MRVIRFKKQGYVILLVISVFVLGNVVLLYKFVSGRSRATLKAVELKKQQILEGLEPAEGHGKGDELRPNNFASQLRQKVRKNKPKRGRIAPVRDRAKELANLNPGPVFLAVTKSAATKLVLTQEGSHKDTSELNMNERKAATELKHVNPKTKSVNFETRLEQNHPTERSYVTAVIVIACNRPTVKRCLDQLLKYRPSAEQFPIIVSQDCGHMETAQVIQTFGSKVVHIKQPDLSEVVGVPSNMRQFQGYYKISRHYKWALGQVFDHMGYERAVVVEDDLDVAPDFFEYFQATRAILEEDPTLWCVSAWNDNGKEGMVNGNDVLYRTDFFPGLGWMLTKSLWLELRPKWPLGFWDDWMREPTQRHDRACIRPEISRTRTFGRIGVSQGQFYDQHLRFIKLNEKKFPFSRTDLTYLLKEKYDQYFLNRVHALPLVTIGQILSGQVSMKEVQIHYSSNLDFTSIAHSVGAMSDFKAGIPRMAYKGVVTVMYKGVRVHLTPE